MDLMDTSDIQKVPAEQLWHLATQWSLDQWRSEIKKLTPDQIPSVIPAATEEQDPGQWRQKTHAFLESLSNPLQLEAVGRVLSIKQIHEIMTVASVSNGPILEKLFPIFVGMPHQNFVDLLLHAPPEQLTLLKQQSITEPVQHHLTLLIQELTADMAKCGMRLAIMESELETLDLSEIETSQIADQERKIELLRESLLSIQFTTGKALALAWNTNRMDLIDKLSKLKEQSQRFIQAVIGSPRSASTEPSGLYAALEKRLDSVFGNSDAHLHTEALQNDEPVIEALVKFSVWYLHDYQEIGLLPQLDNAGPLELDVSNHSEQERLEYREKLFAIVERNLQSLRFFTLADLKQAKIYSKKALKNYIMSHREKMNYLIE